MTDSTERRQHERVRKSFRVEIGELAFPLPDEPGHEASLLDIAAGGVAVLSPVPFEAGTRLQVKIYIASLNKFHSGYLKIFESDAGQYLQAIAEVVRTEAVAGAWRLGVRFLDIHEDDWRALEKVLAKALLDAQSA
jgi:c-di-GMP-binding flagellar brake protein YcgR